MSFKRKKLKQFLPYIMLLVFLSFVSLLTRSLPHLEQNHDFQIFVLGSIFFVGYLINRIAPKTIVPSFVWAIFAGMALQPLLGPFTHDVGELRVIMELLGAIILFAGGLEVPFKSFTKWFFPIASLSLVGVIISSVIFSGLLYVLLNALGIYDSALIPSILILSAALASTDPAAIIPTLKTLHFKRGFLKQIAISESALTDISGSILTRFLLLAFISISAINSDNIFSYFLPLLQKSTYDALALQIISGIVVGYVGFRMIHKFYRDSKKTKVHEEADPALLIAVPIFTFVLGNILGGAGFLAAFVSGLLSDVVGGLKKVTHFYESLLNHLIKPFIFIILGALVPFDILMELAPIGILSALGFMFLIRPLVVLFSLTPWLINHKFHWEDIIFLSFIRETGIIAAILLIIASAYNVISTDFVIAIGMWVILLTLILEPPLTPLLAKKIGVAD